MFYPTIRQMQYLTALNTYASFSKAADACAVTQPTLSAGIKDMETTLGQPLIDRSVRKLRLTKLGQDVLEDCSEILKLAERMTARVKQYEKPMNGTLRLGVIPTIAPYMLPFIMPRIQTTYPNLELQIFEEMSDPLLERLEKGEIDAALMAFPYETPGMHQEALFDEPFLLAVPKARAKDIADHHIESRDLDPGELLLLDEGHCLSDHALEACALQLPKSRKAYSASSLSTLLQIVSGGYGMTLVPEMAVIAQAIPSGVETLNFSAPLPYRKIGLGWRENTPQADTLEAFGALVKEI